MLVAAFAILPAPQFLLIGSADFFIKNPLINKPLGEFNDKTRTKYRAVHVKNRHFLHTLMLPCGG